MFLVDLNAPTPNWCDRSRRKTPAKKRGERSGKVAQSELCKLLESGKYSVYVSEVPERIKSCSAVAAHHRRDDFRHVGREKGRYHRGEVRPYDKLESRGREEQH